MIANPKGIQNKTATHMMVTTGAASLNTLPRSNTLSGISQKEHLQNLMSGQSSRFQQNTYYPPPRSNVETNPITGESGYYNSFLQKNSTTQSSQQNFGKPPLPETYSHFQVF